MSFTPKCASLEGPFSGFLFLDIRLPGLHDDIYNSPRVLGSIRAVSCVTINSNDNALTLTRKLDDVTFVMLTFDVLTHFSKKDILKRSRYN